MMESNVNDARAAKRSRWDKILEEYESQGVRARAFCQSRSLNLRQFYYWKKVLRSDNQTPGDFIELVTKRDNSGVWVSCGSWRVCVEAHFNPAVLRRVVESLS